MLFATLASRLWSSAHDCARSGLLRWVKASSEAGKVNRNAEAERGLTP
jgi:hypothetical protein